MDIKCKPRLKISPNPTGVVYVLCADHRCSSSRVLIHKLSVSSNGLPNPSSSCALNLHFLPSTPTSHTLVRITFGVTTGARKLVFNCAVYKVVRCSAKRFARWISAQMPMLSSIRAHMAPPCAVSANPFIPSLRSQRMVRSGTSGAEKGRVLVLVGSVPSCTVHSSFLSSNRA